MKTLIVAWICIFELSAQADEFSFSQALSEMVDKNVDVQVQLTNLRAADAQVWASWGAFSPTLSLLAQQQNVSGAGSVQSSANYSFQAYSAVSTWNLFRSGADLAGLRTAQYNYRSQTAGLDQAVLAAEEKAGLALLDLILNKMTVDVYRRSESSAQHLLEIAELRFNKGLLSREEMDRVALDASNAQANRADGEILFNNSVLAVESLLGRHDVRLVWPWEKALAIENVQKMLAEVKQSDLEDRPDWRAAHTAVIREDQHSRQLYRSMLPTVDANFAQSEVHLPGQLQAGWSSTATLTIPLWSGLHDYSAYRVQVESKYAADARLGQVQRDAEGGVRTAQTNFKIAYQQFQVRSKNLLRAKHVMEQDEARFRMGRSDANELNLDLTRVTTAELLAIQGIRQAHQTYMELYHAFGRRVP